MQKYKVKFYKNSTNSKEPVLDYITKLPSKTKAKVYSYIELLVFHRGCLDEPYSKHIQGKLRELRVDFNKHFHRIFYFTFINKTIILLHAFNKKTKKTPKREIDKAINNLNDVYNNPKIYE
ncbi:MAG: type II toxin-antitoxin system RelE/ParE family toxin [Candidatus Komeilibacteria bacterium]